MKKFLSVLMLMSIGANALALEKGKIVFSSEDYYKQIIEDSKKNHEYENSRFKNQISQEQYEQIFGSPLDILKEEKKKKFGNKVVGHQGKTITVDTRNKEACEKVRDTLRKYRNDKVYDGMCVTDENAPLVSIYLIEQEPTELKLYLGAISTGKDEPGKYDKILKETRNFTGLGFAMMGLLFALPESVSKWDRSEIIDNLSNKWQDNVKTKPVVDKDDWWINYIGHPVSGAAYHVVARHAGLGPWESFGYGVLMLTFFWEYGLEAVAETPSIQDLFITPILGSLLGELFYKVQLEIKENNGELYGSEALGTVVGVMTNPAKPMLDFFNSIFEAPIFEDGETYITIKERIVTPDGVNEFFREPEIGVNFHFRF
ncbi:MAG: DUF3943 domain-containing protein [Bdellovibrionota bacterium]|nr:DUF3943 domain-containing protein [Bdellovibrionota bacterium]